ncbi:hypothetical protein C8R45DRAFT_966032 [Mycena sanguinolenta]|nr:hypothetical protein C8R45DRAFT_966032 [Mycena sanguinolenta]
MMASAQVIGWAGLWMARAPEGLFCALSRLSARCRGSLPVSLASTATIECDRQVEAPSSTAAPDAFRDLRVDEFANPPPRLYLCPHSDSFPETESLRIPPLACSRPRRPGRGVHQQRSTTIKLRSTFSRRVWALGVRLLGCSHFVFSLANAVRAHPSINPRRCTHARTGASCLWILGEHRLHFPRPPLVESRPRRRGGAWAT